MNPRAELREQLAEQEHTRWSDWQRWCHEVIRTQAGIIPSVEAVLRRWDKQIQTPYEQLSPTEKASDMEQVDRYWPLIDKYAKAMMEKELEYILDHSSGGGDWRRVIEQRLAELRKGGGE